MLKEKLNVKKQKRARGRVMSILLSLAISCSLLPCTVYADADPSCPGDCEHVASIGSTHYDTLEEAFQAADNYSHIDLLCDAVGAGLYLSSSQEDVTLDLNGHTYIAESPAYGNDEYLPQALHIEGDDFEIYSSADKGTITSSGSAIETLVEIYDDVEIYDTILDGTELPDDDAKVVNIFSGYLDIEDSEIYAGSHAYAINCAVKEGYYGPEIYLEDCSVEGIFLADGGEAYIDDGVVIDGHMQVFNGAYVVIYKDATVTCDQNYATIFVRDEDSYLCVKGEVINTYDDGKGEGQFAVATNGSDLTDKSIYIKDDAVVSSENDVAIYLPSGSLYIENGTITGTTAVYYKSSDLSIKGGVFTGTKQATDYCFYNDGCHATGDALVIDKCNYPAGIGEVEIKAGTFVSKHANAVASYVGNGETEPLTGFISGGVYSSDVSAYMADTGAQLQLIDDEYVVIKNTNYTAETEDGPIDVSVKCLNVAGEIAACENPVTKAAVGAILALDDVDQNETPIVNGVTLGTSRVITCGKLTADDNTTSTGKTTLTVTFPAILFDGETQQLTVRTGAGYDFNYYYLAEENIVDNGDDTLTVTLTIDGVNEWVLAAIDKNASLLNFRGDEDAKSVVTDNYGNETITLYEYDYGKFDVDYYFYFDKADETVTKGYGSSSDDTRVYITDENGIMAHILDYEESSFDLIGKLGGDWKKVTYGSYGYTTYLKMPGEYPDFVDDITGKSEVDTTGLTVAVDCEVIGDNGQVIKATYTVKNVSSESKTFSLGSGADVQIGSDDYAPIKALYLDQKHVGLSMTSTQYCDRDENGEFASLAFICMNNAMVNDVDTLWYGPYGSRRDNMFKGTIKTAPLKGTDSGMSYSWQNETINVGETKTYTVLFGIGDVTEIQAEVEKAQEEYISSLYTIQFDYNDGSPVETRQYARDNQYYLPGGAKGDYSLAAWKLGDTIYPINTPIKNLAQAGEELILTAVWKEPCTVTLYDGETPVLTETVKYGATLTLPDAGEGDVPEKEYYILRGWLYNGVVYPAGEKISFAGYDKVDITAVWKENTNTITFDANGGVSVQPSKKLGVTADVYGPLTVPTHLYAEFDGWYDGETLITEDSPAPADDVTLTAHWKNNKSFPVVIDGAADKPAVYDTDFTYTVPDKTQKYNVVITIDGKPYYADNEDGTYTIPGEDIKGEVKITATPVDEETVVLTYMLDGSVVYTLSAKKTDDYPAVDLPAKAGYTTDGWFVSAEPGAAKATGAIGEGATTLYAKSTIKEYSVPFSTGSGSAGPDKEVSYGETITFPANPSKPGYVFLGWKGSNGVVITKENAGNGYPMPDTEDLTFSAMWQKVGDLSVTVVDNEGPVSGAIVNLIANGIVIQSVKTGTDGIAVFDDLTYGAYNIAVVSSVNEFETVTTTAGKDITSDNAEISIHVPDYKLNTVVDSSEVELNLTSENLDNAAYVSLKAGQEVTLTLKATPSDDASKALIDEVVSADNGDGIKRQMIDYIDLSVSKTTRTTIDESTTEVTENISTTSDYQIISVEITEDLYKALAAVDGSVENILVYRLHGGSEVTKLPMTTEKSGKTENRECYWTKTVEGTSYVVIKARNFSSYGFGVQDSPVEIVEYKGNRKSTHSITCTEGVSSTPSNASAGKRVTLTITNKKMMPVVTTRNGERVSVTKISDTVYTFIMPGRDVVITLARAAATSCPHDESCIYAGFGDADTDGWYHDGLHFCVEHGYMAGFPDGSIAPNGTLTRAQVVTILWNMEDNPETDYAMSFEDVAADMWYTDAIRWAQSTGVVKGFNDKEFRPGEAVSRQQLACILQNYAALKGVDVTERSGLAGYIDNDMISIWARESVMWANAVGMLEGRPDATIAPTGNATRAEAACMLFHFCEAIQ